MNNEEMVNNTPTTDPVVEQPATPTVAPTVAPTVEPVSTVQAAPQFDPNVIPAQAPQANKEAKSKKPLIICIVLLVLIAAGVGIYFAFFKKVTGREVINGTINKVFQSAIKASEKIENNVVIDYKNDIVRTNGSLKATINTDDSDIKQALNNLNSVALDYDLRLDLKVLSGSLDLIEKENDKELIELNTYLKDKTLYFKMKDVEGTYKLDMTEAFDWDSIDVSKLPEYKSKSMSAVLKKMQGYLKNAIKDEYITTEEGTFNVDGKEITGIKTTLKLNNKITKEISDSIIDQILNDDEGMNLLAEFTMTDKDTIKTSLEASKSSNDQYKQTTVVTEEDKDVNLNIYTTKRGKFLGFDLITGENDTKAGITAVSENDITEIKFYSKGKETLKLNYNEKEKELVYKNEAEGNKNETLTLKFLEDGIKLTFAMDGGSMSLELTENINKDSVSVNAKAELDYTDAGKNTKASLELSNNMGKTDSLNEINTFGAKDLATMTETEAQEFTTGVTNAFSKSTVYQLIETAAKNTKKQYQQTQTTTTTKYTSPHCATAYNCENYGGEYDYCKYDEDGYTWTVMCPHNN